MDCTKYKYKLQTKPMKNKADLYCNYNACTIHSALPAKLVKRFYYITPKVQAIHAPSWCPMEENNAKRI